MKTKLAKPLTAALLVLSVILIFKIKPTSRQTSEKNSKTFLTVSDAKAKAFKQEQPEMIVTLKGIYIVQQKTGTNDVLQLEDEEPTGMEDIPLYCSFSKDVAVYLGKLEPGTELIVSGKLYWKNNSVEVADCRLICINKGTIEPAELGFSY